MLTLDKVFNAQTVLKNIIRETNVVRAYGIAPECELYLKPENLQITGSFKVRGSAYKIAMLSEEEKVKGVVACSAGNHAQGVALAATKNGIKSLICLPDTAPISKVEATKGFGAEVCLVEGCYDDAYKKALELRDSEGYTFVHPFDDENVIAGQGTIALEILNDLDNIDAIVVPIGGGGLISGIAYTAKQIRPSVKVYGVQVAGAPSMYNSVKDGEIECLSSVSTIADGIAVKQPGENTFRYVSDYVDEIALVTKALLQGKPAANILLTGDAGTGKSSTVKAVANALWNEGLRIVEVRKDQLRSIPKILDELSSNPLKFVLFIDDLSFLKDDDNFNALKAVLEGSVTAKSNNVVIYATSNRRHIIKEKFSDREGDDVHRNDTMQELVSLSERFGIHVTFSKPNKETFLHIVHHLAKENGIDMPTDELDAKAEQFALGRSGRSARLAKQFIDGLLSR